MMPSSKQTPSPSRRTQLDEINSEKQTRMSATVAQWEAESKALVHPMVKIKAMLGEAAKQEIARLRSYHGTYSASLDAYRTQQMAAIRSRSFSPTADTQSAEGSGHPTTVAQLNQMIESITQVAAFKAHRMAVDILISYRSLILECVATNERITSEARREGKSESAIENQEEFLASHVMMLHSSLFPWRDGILFECPSAEMRAELIAKGWASEGESGRLQFHSFAATTVVSRLKQATEEEKRRVISEANLQLHNFFAQ